MARKNIDIETMKDQIISSGSTSSFGGERYPERNNHLTKILAILLVVVAVGAGWFYWKYTEAQKILGGAVGGASQEEIQKEIEKEVREVTAAASKLLILPDETPQIATVVDPKILIEQQPFYEGVEKGDKVLFYAEAKKAVIYSPSRNLIVNVGPVYFSEEAENANIGTTTESVKKNSSN